MYANPNSVSTKHYLRNEPGILYEDLYHLVKFLPACDVPITLDSRSESPSLWGDNFRESFDDTRSIHVLRRDAASFDDTTSLLRVPGGGALPLKLHHSSPLAPRVPRRADSNPFADRPAQIEPELLPGQLPNKTRIYEYFPFNLFPAFQWLHRKRAEREYVIRDRVTKLNQQWCEASGIINLPLELITYMVGMRIMLV